MTTQTDNLFSKFKDSWFNYTWQSLLATICIAILLIILNIDRSPIIIASIGASAFIIFAMPKYITSTPRHVIGGHIVGLIAGLICSLIPHNQAVSAITADACAVGLCMFIMVAIDTEHPPACGTALGIASAGFEWKTVLAVLLGSLILSLAHRLLGKRLKDLV